MLNLDKYFKSALLGLDRIETEKGQCSKLEIRQIDFLVHAVSGHPWPLDPSLLADCSEAPGHDLVSSGKVRGCWGPWTLEGTLRLTIFICRSILTWMWHSFIVDHECTSQSLLIYCRGLHNSITRMFNHTPQYTRVFSKMSWIIVVERTIAPRPCPGHLIPNCLYYSE